jgi:site-specific DNA-methyltransferase (adenine-specific)
MQVTEKITITNEDNMLLMARYPDNYFDLAIVDPPYGINIANKKGHGRRKKGNSFTNYTPKNWDNEKPNYDYWIELFRISKNQIVFGGNYFCNYLPPSMGWVFWDKQFSEDFSFAAGELIFTSFQTSLNKIIIKRSEWINCVSTSKEKVSLNRIHPTQKPPQLYKWLLDKYAKENDKILDTHLGSGSIAIACHDYGFELTACELDKEYYDKAIQRIKNHTNQQKLF